MTLKNISFVFFSALVIMIAIKLIKTDQILPSFEASSVQGFIVMPNTDSTSEKAVTVQFQEEKPLEQDRPIEQEKSPSVSSLDGYEQLYSGIFYRKEGNTATVRVDLNNPDVRFFVNPASSPLTVCSHLSKYGLQFATNGGDFDIGGTGQAKTFAMSEGVIYSWDRKPDITIFVDNNNHLTFSTSQSIPENARYAVTGFNRVVKNGEMLSQFHPGNPGYKSGYGTLRPRTTYGISGDWLNIVLFDYGISITDAGQYHLDHFSGTEHVFNMDGGGSTNACTDSYGSLVTETGRPVANIFGIYSQPVH